MIAREKKKPPACLKEGVFKIDFGLQGDIHGGPGDKQVVLFGIEGMEKLKKASKKGLCFERFSPTLVTEGVELFVFPVGTHLKIRDAGLEISRIGKRCYPDCDLVQAKTPCIMPKEVVFARVIKEGLIRVGDEIQVVETI